MSASVEMAFGQIIAWGSNFVGEGTVPENSGDIVAISAGPDHNLALTKDGTVIAWGNNANNVATVPGGLGSVVAIASGGSHNLALKADGTVAAWGSDYWGNTAVPPGLSQVRAIAAGDTHSLALTDKGTVVAWGNNSNGQTNVPAGLNNVVAIAARGNYSMALTAQGKAMVWGDNFFGQASVPVDLTNAIVISTGYNHSLALTDEGTVVGWGNNGFGLTEIPANLDRITAISAGLSHNLALTGQGMVVAWGDNNSGQIEIPPDLINVTAISAGMTHNLALIGNGSPRFQPAVTARRATLNLPARIYARATGAEPISYQWQFNGVTMPDQTDALLRISEAVRPEHAGTYTVIASNSRGTAKQDFQITTSSLQILVSPGPQTAFPGHSAHFEVMAEGTGLTYQWRLNGTDLPGQTNTQLTILSATRENGGTYSVAVRSELETVVSADAPLLFTDIAQWGSRSQRNTDPPAVSGIVAIASGSQQSMALNRNGTVTVWGTGSAEAIPPAATNVIAIACRDFGKIAVRSDGKVIIWNGGYPPPSGLSNMIAVAAGINHNLALRSDGTVVAWGLNDSGQATVPQPLSPIIAIAAGANHSLALTSQGTIVGWGNNEFEQAAAPAARTDIVAIATGDQHSLALTSDGRVIAWGNNDLGQTEVPPELSDVISIAASGNHSLALKRDGTVAAWGFLEDSTSSESEGLTNIAAIACGFQDNLALVGSGPPQFAPGITNRTATFGSSLNLFATAVGQGPLSYQWQFNGTTLPGETNPVLRLQNASTDRSGTYTLIASNALGTAARRFEAIFQPFQILAQPVGAVVVPGATATFSITAAGPGLHYQWRFNGTDLPGQTNTQLTLAPANPENAGTYSVRISNDYGSVISESATLTISELITWGESNFSITPPPSATNITAIAAGSGFSLALTAKGTVVAWGNNNITQTNVPSGVLDIVAVSAGFLHSLALRSSGLVTGWGDTSYGKAKAPSSLRNVISIAAGLNYSLALTANGLVTAWGDNTYGQTNVPAGLSNIIAIATGGNHTLALTSGGTVAAWGSNQSHQTEVPPALSDVIAISAGINHSIALTSQGTVVAWGDNSSGQTNVPPGLRNVIAIAAGPTGNLALKNDGAVVAWGNLQKDEAEALKGVSNIVAVALGESHGLALVGQGLPRFGPLMTNRLGAIGAPLNLFAPATGGQPVSYQWQFNGLNLPGQTNSLLRLVGNSVDQAGPYTLVASNAQGMATQTFQVTLRPIQMDLQPLDRSAWLGAHVIFKARAQGANLRYQWRLNGTDLPGQTNPDLAIALAGWEQAGDYSVAITNQAGSAISRNAKLSLSSIVQWNGFTHAETQPPAGLRNVIAADGYSFAAALTADGVITEWGNEAILPAIPSNLRDITAFTAGTLHLLALRSDGKPLGFGNNLNGAATIPLDLTNAVAVSAGELHSMALKADGTVVTWGGYGSGPPAPPPGLRNIVAISSGPYNNLALSTDGRVTAWSRPEFPEFNTVPAGLSNVIAIAAGIDNNLALRADGLVVSWGQSGFTKVPQDVKKVVAIAAGGHNLALTAEGSVIGWIADFLIYVPDGLEKNVTAIGQGSDFDLALIGEGPPRFAPAVTNRLGLQGLPVHIYNRAVGEQPISYQWHFNGAIMPGENNALLRLPEAQPQQAGTYTLVASNSRGQASQTYRISVRPIDLAQQPAGQRKGIGSAVTFEVIAKGVGLRYQWRLDGKDLPNQNSSKLIIDHAGPNDSGMYSVVVSNDYGSVTSEPALLSLSAVAAWGSDDYRQQQIPPDLDGLIALSAGDKHNLAVKADGSVVAWGDDSYGQCDVSADLKGVLRVAGGGHHSLALKADGTAVGWGYNRDGQASIPQGLTNLVAIAAGANHSLALTVDGIVKAWGADAFGASSVPPALGKVSKIAAGSYHNLALTTDGKVFAWGANGSGQTNVPKNLSNVVAIAAGGFHSVALRKDGTLVIWGSSSYGQTNNPAGLGNVVDIACGGDHILALKADGTVAAWGRNDSHQTDVPSSLSNVTAIFAGGTHSLALIGKAATPSPQFAGGSSPGPELNSSPRQNRRSLPFVLAQNQTGAGSQAADIPKIEIQPGNSGNVTCFENPNFNYTLYLPPAYSTNGSPLPLLITFNSSGGGMVTEFARVAAQLQVIVVGIPGPRTGVPMWSYIDGEYAVCRDLRQRLYYDPTAVFAGGFSEGGWISFDFAKFQRPFVAGVLCMGGLMGTQWGPTDRFLTNLVVARVSGTVDTTTLSYLPFDAGYLQGFQAVVRDWSFSGGVTPPTDPLKREALAWLIDQHIPPGPADKQNAEAKAAAWRSAMANGQGEKVLRECVASILTKPRTYEAHHAQLVLDELQSDYDQFRHYDISNLASGDDAVDLFYFRAFGAGKLSVRTRDKNVYLSSIKALAGIADSNKFRLDNLLDLFKSYGTPTLWRSITARDGRLTLTYSQDAPFVDYWISATRDLGAGIWDPVTEAPRLEAGGIYSLEIPIQDERNLFFQLQARPPSPVGWSLNTTGTKFQHP